MRGRRGVSKSVRRRQIRRRNRERAEEGLVVPRKYKSRDNAEFVVQLTPLPRLVRKEVQKHDG